MYSLLVFFHRKINLFRSSFRIRGTSLSSFPLFLNFPHVFGLVGDGVGEVGLKVANEHPHTEENPAEHQRKTEPEKNNQNRFKL
jgi:hypothetical protein